MKLVATTTVSPSRSLLLPPPAVHPLLPMPPTFGQKLKISRQRTSRFSTAVSFKPDLVDRANVIEVITEITINVTNATVKPGVSLPTNLNSGLLRPGPKLLEGTRTMGWAAAETLASGMCLKKRSSPHFMAMLTFACLLLGRLLHLLHLLHLHLNLSRLPLHQALRMQAVKSCQSLAATSRGAHCYAHHQPKVLSQLESLRRSFALALLRYDLPLLRLLNPYHLQPALMYFPNQRISPPHLRPPLLPVPLLSPPLGT
mmetsp:Transcript_9757/g.14237  ORF Transcript_9757/g.14237 Transcript_9757/m.14237 type:complete len:257 (-) Transcript_9757:243-1013(-)